MSLRVAGVQMNTRGDVAANVRAAAALVEEAAAAGARPVALPETWAYKGGRRGIRATAEAVDGPSNAALAKLAARLGIFVLAGSIYEPAAEPGYVYNTSALFGPHGGLLGAYRKIHLFDVTAGTTVYRESDEVKPGADLVTVTIDSGAAAPVTLGLTICYDLRFPELYRSLALRGAQVLCVPSAFTAYTGAAHWEILLRARAIENLAYVLASAQGGVHENKRKTWGHSMIIGPWGEVLAEQAQGNGVVVAEVMKAALQSARTRLPALDHAVL